MRDQVNNDSDPFSPFQRAGRGRKWPWSELDASAVQIPRRRCRWLRSGSDHRPRMTLTPFLLADYLANSGYGSV